MEMETQEILKDLSLSRIFHKNFNSNSRILVNEGSSRSTKTFSIIQCIILWCLESEIKVTICRLKLTWAKMTVIPDFQENMKNIFCIWNEMNWNKSECTYKFDNGSEISFVGADEPQKFHGKKQDIAWINEAIEIEYADFLQFLIRTSKKIILDYNPSAEQHWIYDKVITRDDCTFIKSTYKNNPFLSQDIIQEIERMEPTPDNIKQGTADEVSWKIYGLGERAAHKGLIFAKAKICKELPPQNEWKKHFYGLDFGFANDPTALTEVVLAHGDLYLHQKIYKKGLTNIINPLNPRQQSIQQLFMDLNIPKNVNIWADSAEPKSITDLRNCGWNVKEAVKGPDSIRVGIETMLRYNIWITESSTDMIKEKNNYKWKEDKSGTLVNEPIDNWNHCFVGNTLIQTNEGFKKIIHINSNDKVLTSRGYKKVLKKWNNGIKKVNTYLIITDKYSITLECTPDHKIKTNKGWIEICNLKKNHKIFLSKNFLETNTNYIKDKDISLEEEKGFTESFGNILMVLFQKISIFIIKMKTLLTMIFQILKSSIKKFIYLIMPYLQKENRNCFKIFIKQFKKLLYGINQKKEESGIISTIKKCRSYFIKKRNLIACSATLNLKNMFIKSFAQINVNLNGDESRGLIILLKSAFFAKKNSHRTNTLKVISAQINAITVLDSKNDYVYDLTIEEVHEYFANGILVHNCFDASRYGCVMELRKPTAYVPIAGHGTGVLY